MLESRARSNVYNAVVEWNSIYSVVNAMSLRANYIQFISNSSSIPKIDSTLL